MENNKAENKTSALDTIAIIIVALLIGGIFIYGFSEGIAQYKRDIGAVSCYAIDAKMVEGKNTVEIVFDDIDQHRIWVVETTSIADATRFTQRPSGRTAMTDRSLWYMVFDLENMLYSAPEDGKPMHQAVNITYSEYEDK